MDSLSIPMSLCCSSFLLHITKERLLKVKQSIREESCGVSFILHTYCTVYAHTHTHTHKITPRVIPTYLQTRRRRSRTYKKEGKWKYFTVTVRLKTERFSLHPAEPSTALMSRKCCSAVFFTPACRGCFFTLKMSVMELIRETVTVSERKHYSNTFSKEHGGWL